MTMIKPKLTFFKMKIKVWFMNASQLGQPSLGDAPEVLDAVDVVRSIRKFVFAMMGYYKMAVILFNVTPYLVLRFAKLSLPKSENK